MLTLGLLRAIIYKLTRDEDTDTALAGSRVMVGGYEKVKKLLTNNDKHDKISELSRLRDNKEK